MSDLVQRLREAEAPSRRGFLPARGLYIEAADEITRLRDRVKALEDFFSRRKPTEDSQ